MANLFGKNCNSDILNSEDEKKSYSKAIFSLKRDHIFAGNESAEAIQVGLDPDSFEIIPRTCNSPLLKIKTVDHGILSGLGDDDHSQYVHTSLIRQISADHEFTGNPIFSGSPQFSGAIKDSRGNIGADGLVPVITQAGKFEWGVVNLADYSHGDLSELDADDHLQYVHISENREVSADHSFSGDLDFTGDGSVALRGIVKDTNGNIGTEGQVPIARADGKFEWKSQDIENVFWVSKDGDDNNDGLSPQTAKASIKAAVRAAYSGVRGKLLDAAESILANKKFITEEVSGQLYTRNFTLPNSTPFDLKSRNAYKIILQNKNTIVSEAISVISSNPAYSFSDAGGKCTRDSKFLVLAIAKDLFYGGYSNTYRVISRYFNANGVLIPTVFNPSAEKTATIAVFNDIKIRIKALLSEETYTFIRKKIDLLFDFVIKALEDGTLQNAPSPEEQKFIKEKIYYNLDDLVNQVWADTIAQSAYSGIGSTEQTCKRDIRYVAIAAAEDLETWGNSNITDATLSYFGGTTIFSDSTERLASAYAYGKLRDLIIAYTTNVSVISQINEIFAPLITSLTDNSINNIKSDDIDAGILNKSARLCNRDLGYFIDAIASDMKNGGNVFSVEFAEGYYDGNNLQFVSGQLVDTIWTFNRARELMIYAMKNWRINDLGNIYVSSYSLEQIFIDNSIVYEDWPACANAETAIDTYYAIVEDILNNGPKAIEKNAQRLIYESIGKGNDPNSVINEVWRETAIEYPLIEYTEGKCKRDIILVAEAIADDLYSTGNSNIIEVINSYFPSSGNPIETQITETIYAYNELRNYINDNILSANEFSTLKSRVTTLIGYLTQALAAGNTDNVPVVDIGTWSIQKPSYKTTIFVNPGVYNEENPIHLPPNTVVTGDSLRGITVNALNRTLDLFHVNNACGLSFMTFSNHLAPSYAVSFPKKNNQGIAGIISRSPYVQQCTSITTTGGGMLVDGAITEGFKSMVLDSYTQYNQGGPGVKIINNGYAQLVSLFTISCSTGIECASGGQCDLTNSNSSLGDYGLVADGLGTTEIVATVLEDVSPGDLIVKVKVPGTLKPYNGQAGYFGAPYYSVREVKILNKGAGYTTTPTVTIGSPDGPNAIPATARAVIDNGSLSEIIILKSGTSYTSVPDIQITAPTGPGAIAPTLQVELAPIYYRVITATDIDPVDRSTTISLITPVLYPISKGSSFILSRQSKVLASGHSFEYIGAGPDIRVSLPVRNGSFIQQQEVDERRGGSVIFTSTDQSGNFRIGDGVIIDQASGTIGGISFSRGLFAQITPLILALQ